MFGDFYNERFVFVHLDYNQMNTRIKQFEILKWNYFLLTFDHGSTCHKYGLSQSPILHDIRVVGARFGSHLFEWLFFIKYPLLFTSWHDIPRYSIPEPQIDEH